LLRLFAFLFLMSSFSLAAPGKPQSAGNKQAKQDPQAARKKFALEVVQMATALPQPDPQDRLRVLSSAASVARPLAQKTAQQFASEAARIESELVASGQQPAVSIFSTGMVDCATAANFVDSLPPASVERAESSLLGAISSCPAQVGDSARRKLETALQAGVLAPRAMLAMMDRSGATSAWTQREFSAMFSSLPSDADRAKSEAPNFAAMFNSMAPQIDKDTARDAGLHLLAWLGKVNASPERNLAVNITTDTLKQILGDQAYQEALRADVDAQSAAATAGQPADITPPEEESVSVLKAMNHVKALPGTGPAEEMKDVPASQRARQAAADGFAAGTSGKPALASRYFDVAFAAVDDVWSNRTPKNDAPAVLEEVAEAAANVNAVNALQRAQHLQDSTAQAIAMLAVARVVVDQQ
jgi:hypothetical protein